MEGKNSNKQHQPRRGDGTLPEKHPNQEANWFGTSHEPQEEFTEQATEASPEKSRGEASEGPMSDAKPTLGHDKH